MFFMNKAFIFDMDGVIVDSENAWEEFGDNFLQDLLGKETAEKIGDTIGMTVNTIYDFAAKHGFSMNREEYFKFYDKKAAYVYSKSKLTPGIEKLGAKLIYHGFKIGLVTSSRTIWANNVLPRLSFADNIDCFISINDRDNLRPKPAPDAYLEAIEKLGTTPKSAIILEDSNSGIKAAKSAGAFTIGFRQNLVPGYLQEGADVYAKNMEEVLRIVNMFLKLDSISQKS